MGGAVAAASPWLLAVAGATIVAAGAAVAWHFHQDRLIRQKVVDQAALLESQSARIVQLEDQLTGKKHTLEGLRSALQRTDEELNRLLSEERRRVQEARRLAGDVMSERDRVRAQLQAALQELKEAQDHDEQLAAWSRHPVPVSAWQRLRAVAEGH